MTPETATRLFARVQRNNPDNSDAELLAAFARAVLDGGMKKAAQDEKARLLARVEAIDAEIDTLP